MSIVIGILALAVAGFAVYNLVEYMNHIPHDTDVWR